jgi:O-antigen ligase
MAAVGRGRLIAWLVIAALATYLLFFGGAWLGLYISDLRILTVTAAAGLLVAWAAVARTNPAWRPRSTLLPAIFAALGSLAISTAFSRFPRVSLEYLGYAVVLAALYLLLVRLFADPFFRNRLIALASVLFVAVVAGYAFLVVRHWVDWWSATGSLSVPPLRPDYESLTYGTPSTVLTVAAMLAVPAIASALGSRRLGLPMAVGILGLVAAIAILTGSRAGWLAIAIAALVTGLGALAEPTARARIRAAVAESRFRRVVPVIVLLALGVAVVLGPAVLRRAASGGEENRLTFVRIALELFTESPVVGTGPGSWVIERLPLTEADEPDEYIPHAHNVYAQTLGELGLVGAAAGLLLGVSLALLCWRAIRSADTSRRTWGWLSLAALIYFAAHQLLDFYPNMPAVLFTAAIPVAFLDAIQLENPTPTTRRRSPANLPRAVQLAAALVVAIALAGLLLQEIPARASDQAVDLANSGDWAAALEPASTAARQDPAISPYVFTAGLAAARSGDHAAAAEDFRVVAERDDFPEAWLNLAAEQTELGLKDEALVSIKGALRLGRQRPAISMPAGDLALRNGDESMAIGAFVAAIAVTPSLAGDPWWTADRSRNAIWPTILEDALAGVAPGTRWEIALVGGDVEAARAAVAETGAQDYAIAVIDAWTGDQHRLDDLLAACDANPTALFNMLWCARLADHAGHPEAASRYRYIANVQFAGIYRMARELRVDLDPPTAYPILEGGVSIAWGTYTYRRVTPWDVLAPGLIRLGFD